MGPPHPRSKGRDRVRDPVIGGLHDEAAAVTRGHLGHPPCHIVRLAAGIDENAGIEMRRQTGGQALRVIQDSVVQVARVSGQDRRLALDRRDDRGCAWPTCGTLL